MACEIELSEFTDESESGSGFEEGASSPFRGQRTSWAAVPQGKRAVTLQELWDLYNAHKMWLEEKLWRCDSCKRCHQQTEGPCPDCRCNTGAVQMRNLYEVNDVIIKPACADQQISYAELLAKQRAVVVEVDTFVSHWWGEEFPKLVKSLHRYARVQCALQHRWWPSIVTFVLSALLCPMAIGMLMPAHYTKPQWKALRYNSLQVMFLSGVNIFLIVVITTLCAISTLKRRDPMQWSFWICAFCNNQFFVDHAMGIAGDVTTTSFAAALRADSCKGVAAVIDCHGEIYRRIWCDFELFFVSTVLPRMFDRHLEISMVNEYGVLSDGDASRRAITDLRCTISGIQTANSRASVEADRKMIHDALLSYGTSYAHLDDILRDLADAGVKATIARRWAPLVLFSLGPLTGFLCAIGLNGCWNVIRNHLLDQKFVQVRHHRQIVVYIPGFIFYLRASRAAFGLPLALILLFAIKHCLGLRFRRHGAASTLNSYQRRLAFRVLWMVLLFATPAGSITALNNTWQGLVRLNILPYHVRYAKILLLAGALGQVSAIIMAFVGAFLGAIYMLIRDWSKFKRIRFSVEDVLFT